MLSTDELRGNFDSSRSADETAAKLHPNKLSESVDAIDVTSDRMPMVGCTSRNLMMTQNSGCFTSAVGFGAHQLAALFGQRSLEVAHSVFELRHFLVTFA